MKSLVSINISPNTQQALCYAVTLINTSLCDTTESYHTSTELLILHKNQAGLNVDHSFQGIPHTYHFIKDKFTRGIQRFLMRSSADLVVVVPRHHAELEQLFQKSVAHQLVRRDSLPVLSTHE